MKQKKKVVVALSGGVDSAVAAKILKDKGYEVTGVFLYFWKDDFKGEDFNNKCCSFKALLDARRVCAKIKIPFYTMNFSKDFKKKVVDNFIREYARGRTPNPCARCNKMVKLGLLLKRAHELGFNYVASGHYALLQKKNNKYFLYKAKDKNKDQSYFLYNFNQKHLKHLLFPLGNYTKREVRILAKKFKLPVAEKKESQEICFVPDKNHNNFLKRYLKLRPGKIMLWGTKKILGEHLGLPLYTIGQRKGVEIGGQGPYYVIKIDYKKNILYVVKKEKEFILFKDKFCIEKINWIFDKRPKLPLNCETIIRYRHCPVKCKIIKKNKKYLVFLENPQRAITPGQSAVFYQGTKMLGGGIIQ